MESVYAHDEHTNSLFYWNTACWLAQPNKACAQMPLCYSIYVHAYILILNLYVNINVILMLHTT